MLISTLRELGYLAIHLCHVLGCWSYDFFVLFAYQYLYYFLSPATKAYLDHEYKIVNSDRRTLLSRLWYLCALIAHPDGLFHFFHPPPHLSKRLARFYRARADRTDTPSAAFLRIVENVCLLHTSPHPRISLEGEILDFWYRGITGASKPDHFLFGGKWHIKDLPDPRGKLRNDPLLCAIAASTAEHMAEVYNWRISMGIRRDLKMLRARRPHWDKNLVPCELEKAPEWCEDVGPAPVQTVVDREGGEDTARGMLESTTNGLSPSFRKRNLLASSTFMYFA